MFDFVFLVGVQFGCDCQLLLGGLVVASFVGCVLLMMFWYAGWLVYGWILVCGVVCLLDSVCSVVLVLLLLVCGFDVVFLG